MARTSGICGLAAVFALAAAPAHADFRVCNNSSARVSVSIAYTDGAGWVSEGWWNIKTEHCETLLRGPLAAEFYYAYACVTMVPLLIRLKATEPVIRPSRSRRTKINAKARPSRNSLVERRPSTLIPGRVKGRFFRLFQGIQAVSTPKRTLQGR